jgi:hypothetical protein
LFLFVVALSFFPSFGRLLFLFSIKEWIEEDKRASYSTGQGPIFRAFGDFWGNCPKQLLFSFFFPLAI